MARPKGSIIPIERVRYVGLPMGLPMGCDKCHKTSHGTQNARQEIYREMLWVQRCVPWEVPRTSPCPTGLPLGGDKSHGTSMGSPTEFLLQLLGSVMHTMGRPMSSHENPLGTTANSMESPIGDDKSHGTPHGKPVWESPCILWGAR